MFNAYSITLRTTHDFCNIHGPANGRKTGHWQFFLLCSITNYLVKVFISNQGIKCMAGFTSNRMQHNAVLNWSIQKDDGKLYFDPTIN